MSLVIDATVRLHAVPHGDYLALLYDPLVTARLESDLCASHARVQAPS